MAESNPTTPSFLWYHEQKTSLNHFESKHTTTQALLTNGNIFKLKEYSFASKLHSPVPSDVCLLFFHSATEATVDKRL